MKSLITFTIMAIILIAGLLAFYNPPEEHTVPMIEVKPVSQATRPVILIPNREMKLAAELLSLHSIGGEIDRRVAMEQERRALIDHGKLPGGGRSHNFD